MKKTIRILLPVFLVLIIVASSCWYLFVYDREFTRDMLVSFARMSENQGNHGIATWFYNQAYSQAGDNDSVAIELAQQHKKSGNYTKAEYTLSNAIADGGGITLYIELCKIYVEQDKLLDAVNMLNKSFDFVCRQKRMNHVCNSSHSVDCINRNQCLWCVGGNNRNEIAFFYTACKK